MTIEPLSEIFQTVLRDALSRLIQVHKNFTLNIQQINVILTDTILYMYIALMLLNKHCPFYIIIFYSKTLYNAQLPLVTTQCYY